MMCLYNDLDMHKGLKGGKLLGKELRSKSFRLGAHKMIAAIKVCLNVWVNQQRKLCTMC